MSLAGNGKLESITVVELRSDRGTAVVKLADGKKEVLKLGDAIPGTHAVVSQILPDKLVIVDVVEKKRLSETNGIDLQAKSTWREVRNSTSRASRLYKKGLATTCE